MSNFKSLSEMYIQEQVKANVLSSLVEVRRKSLDTLTKENEILRTRAEKLEKKITDLENEILNENETTQINDGNTFPPYLDVGNRVLEKSVCDILSTILPPSPNEEQIRAYLRLLGHSKATETFARFLQEVNKN